MYKTVNMFVVVLFLSACAMTPPEVRLGAAQGAAMTSSLQTDIQDVIKSSQNLYEQRVEIVNDGLKNYYISQQVLLMNTSADAFGKANKSTSVEAMGTKVGTFMNTVMQSWSDNNSGYEKRVQSALKRVRDNRSKMALDVKKLKKLRANFLALSTKETGKETLKFLIRFSRQVKDEYERQKEKATARNKDN